MKQINKLDESEVRSRLRELAEWHVDDGKLHREFVFKDFVEAFSFMTRAAFLVEKMNHCQN
jgi:4a-hydroxytetrahydrobiopterin dehydratase